MAVRFYQADMERVIRAAKQTGAIVRVDLKNLSATIIPTPKSFDGGPPIDPSDPEGNFAPDGKDNFDE